MSRLALLTEVVWEESSPPSLGLFLLGAVAGFVVLAGTLWLGRSVESGMGRLLLFLLSLVLATLTALLILVLFGGMSFDLITKTG